MGGGGGEKKNGEKSKSRIDQGWDHQKRERKAKLEIIENRECPYLNSEMGKPGNPLNQKKNQPGEELLLFQSQKELSR